MPDEDAPCEIWLMALALPVANDTPIIGKATITVSKLGRRLATLFAWILANKRLPDRFQIARAWTLDKRNGKQGNKDQRPSDSSTDCTLWPVHS